MVGAYSLQNNTSDMFMMLIFGILGFLMKKFGYEGAPLILALVLGQKLETSLRRSLIMSFGDFSIFFSRPISLAFLLIAFALVVIPIITQRKRLAALEEESQV
jgi:putative tricarboxylic transport membrane protein